VAGVRRAAARQALRVLNTGYSEGGASKRHGWTKGWRSRGGSPREDIELNLWTLRERSRELYMTSGIARGALGRIRTNVVGPGLQLRAIPDAEALGISSDAAKAWARGVEREFRLWAESRDCDSTGLNTFNELQQIALLSWLQSGDVFGVLEASAGSGPYGLCVHLIEADRVCSEGMMGPMGLMGLMGPEAARMHDGVETDAGGRVVAYHVVSRHPLATQAVEQATWQRIPVRGESGRLNIVHLVTCERPEQYRGVPILAPVIRDLKHITRYGEAELEGAVVSALLAVFVKSTSPETPLGESVAESDRRSDEDLSHDVDLGPATMVSLGQDEEIAGMTPTRPNAGYPAFVSAVAREIGAAINVPAELLLLQFTSSYSASRAALLEAWKGFREWRQWMSMGFCGPIYEEWLVEAVLLGRVRAPGFLTDAGLRAAWRRAQWYGPSPGQMNPIIEVTAAANRVANGFSTYAQEAMEISGRNFDEICEEQAIERGMLREAGILVSADEAGL
jgi:lambda family phage portal protein